MIYLELFLTFLKLGTFAFGGAYGAIPLFRTEVLSKAWMSDEMFTNIVSISESTSGPIMVNIATYIGSDQAGFFGAILATIGVILPSFVILLLVTIVFTNLLKKTAIQGAVKGIKQCVMGLILATGILIAYRIILVRTSTISIDFIAIEIFAIALISMFIYKKITHKESSPILIILICAILGGILY